jgi:hypothetical protein
MCDDFVSEIAQQMDTIHDYRDSCMRRVAEPYNAHWDYWPYEGICINSRILGIVTRDSMRLSSHSVLPLPTSRSPLCPSRHAEKLCSHVRFFHNRTFKPLRCAMLFICYRVEETLLNITF